MVTFAVLVLVISMTYVWQRDVLTSTARERVAAVAAVQEARIQDYVAAGTSNLDLVASRGPLLELLAAYSESPDPATAESMRDRILQTASATPSIHAVYLFDADLDQVASTEPDRSVVLEAPDPEYLEQATRVRSLGRVVEVHEGQVAHLIAGPLTLDGETIGVAAVAQDTGPLFDLVSDYTGLGETGEIVIAQRLDGGGAQFIAPARFDPDATLKREIRSNENSLPIHLAIRGVETVSSRSIDYRGEPVISSSRSIEGTQWGLVVKVDAAEALAPLGDFTRTMVLALIIASVVAAVLGWVMARMVRHPIKEMTETASAIARGERHLRVPVERQDEIGELGSAFNQMTTQFNTLNASLENRVVQRTAEISEKNHQLEKLMKDKETFIAGLSHEVRTPLTAMIGFLDLVNDPSMQTDEAGRQQMLETASEQASEVLNLIEDLLTAARAEAGTLNVVDVSVNMGAQVRQVAEGLGAERAARVEISTSDAIAEADPGRVRQIIRNLLTNAFRYGGPRIEIISRVEGGKAVLQVRDDGGGIPAADRERIFEAYGQAASSRLISGSVGLGLHVSRELAQAMGGDLIYEKTSEWSTFRLVLPLHEEGEE